MSYSGEFGAASGQYGDTATAAASKALKGDQLLTMVEVGDEGACPVEEKDVDERTVAALKARGIENFTPVQVGVCCWKLRQPIAKREARACRHQSRAFYRYPRVFHQSLTTCICLFLFIEALN